MFPGCNSSKKWSFYRVGWEERARDEGSKWYLWIFHMIILFLPTLFNVITITPMVTIIVVFSTKETTWNTTFCNICMICHITMKLFHLDSVWSFYMHTSRATPLNVKFSKPEDLSSFLSSLHLTELMEILLNE